MPPLFFFVLRIFGSPLPKQYGILFAFPLNIVAFFLIIVVVMVIVMVTLDVGLTWCVGVDSQLPHCATFPLSRARALVRNSLLDVFVMHKIYQVTIKV